MITATPVIAGKLWELKEDGRHKGVVRTEDNNFVVSTSFTQTVMSQDEVESMLGINLLHLPLPEASNKCLILNGFPTSCFPYNAELNLKTSIWTFTKSAKSKSKFAAGYYVVKFNKKWIKSFCPKLITLERNVHYGPFKTLDEAKECYQNVTPN